VHCLCIVYALFGAYLVRRWAIWFYIKSGRFDVEFVEIDVGLHHFVLMFGDRRRPGGDAFLSEYLSEYFLLYQDAW
jgi:hypothetical protein